MVGLIPLLAVETIEPELLERLPGLPRAAGVVPHATAPTSWATPRRSRERAKPTAACSRSSARRGCARSSARMLDENEFLSPLRLALGLALARATTRSVSRSTGSDLGEVDYEPAESRSGLFGGNSNWRGPVWFPLNYLIIEALQKFDWYYGDDFTRGAPGGLRADADAVGGRRSSSRGG